jgi:hypothetical protein
MFMKALDNCLALIQRGQLKEALEALAAILKDEDSDLKNTVVQILARYNRLDRDRLRGIRSEGEYSIEFNQITYSAISLIDLMKSEAGFRTPEPEPKPYEGEKIRILFMAASPDDEARLHLGLEAREIEETLRSCTHRDRFEFRHVAAARPDDLLTELMRFKPHFVHVSGHGTRDAIYLLDDDHLKKPIPKEILSEVFRFFKEIIGCVLLNSCYSALQAEAIHTYIPCVIGTTDRVRDGIAIQFSKRFYQAIGEGNDTAFAFEFAKLGMDVNGWEEAFVMLGGNAGPKIPAAEPSVN